MSKGLGLVQPDVLAFISRFGAKDPDIKEALTELLAKTATVVENAVKLSLDPKPHLIYRVVLRTFNGKQIGPLSNKALVDKFGDIVRKERPDISAIDGEVGDNFFQVVLMSSETMDDSPVEIWNRIARITTSLVRGTKEMSKDAKVWDDTMMVFTESPEKWGVAGDLILQSFLKQESKSPSSKAPAKKK